MHLALDRPALIEVVKDVAPMLVGGFIYPFSDFATPKEELDKRIGYQADPAAAIKEARALMAAAGHDGIKGAGLPGPRPRSFKLWSQAIQAMLQETLNINCNLRTVVESVWFDDIANGQFDLAIGAVVSTLLDPSDYFNAWYRNGGPQNYSYWGNQSRCAGRADRPGNRPGKRQELIRQAEAIFEQDPPLLPVAWEKIDDVWYNYVKGLRPDEYFGAYDVCRQDTFWLDKIMILNEAYREANDTMDNTKTAGRGWTRRALLQGSAAAMAAAYGLRPAHTLAEIPDAFDGSKFQLAAPEPNPKRGGVLRIGILNRLPHFDFHQSGTVGNLGAQGCMYDNLIRHDPRDSGKTIIPDLAHSWEISKDGKTYTFFLRKGVQFHDGAELTSDDVKATFDRIAKPPAGVSIPRSILFKAVSEITAPDTYTVSSSWPRRVRRAS